MLSSVEAGLVTDAAVVADSLDQPEAFGALFERHFDEIHRYLRRRLPADAEELAAEVFVAAFDGRARFRAPAGGSARPWLYGIASNLLYKRRRREARALRALARWAADPAAVDDPADAGPRIDADRQSAALAAALGRLRPDDRNVLLLFALADLSYDEIANALEIPLGTVRSRLARARRECGLDLGGMT